MALKNLWCCLIWLWASHSSAQINIGSTKGSPPKTEQGQNGFLLPGTPKDTVLAKWGKPDEVIGNIYVYRQQGSLIYLSADQHYIMAFVGSWFPGFGGFSQRILGIGLGTTYPKCVSILGPPTWRKPLVENIEEAYWTFGEFEIRCEIWTQNDYDPDIGGNIYAETVKRIQIQKPWKP